MDDGYWQSRCRELINVNALKIRMTRHRVNCYRHPSHEGPSPAEPTKRPVGLEALLGIDGVLDKNWLLHLSAFSFPSGHLQGLIRQCDECAARLCANFRILQLPARIR